MWSRPEAYGQTEFALQVAVSVISFYETFFDIAYPLPKQGTYLCITLAECNNDCLVRVYVFYWCIEVCVLLEYSSSVVVRLNNFTSHLNVVLIHTFDMCSHVITVCLYAKAYNLLLSQVECTYNSLTIFSFSCLYCRPV